jgi:hypothetical protein
MYHSGSRDFQRTKSMPGPDNPAEILARFPGPVMLLPSRKKWLGILLLCVVFVAIAVWMILTGDSSDQLDAWGALAFFGVGAVICVVALLPGAGGLKLDRETFKFTNLYRTQSMRWQDTSGFITAKIPPARKEFVVFDDVNAKKRMLAKFNVGLIGRNSGLPDTYGLSATDLANLMAQWRDRAVTRK